MSSRYNFDADALSGYIRPVLNLFHFEQKKSRDNSVDYSKGNRIRMEEAREFMVSSLPGLQVDVMRIFVENIPERMRAEVQSRRPAAQGGDQMNLMNLLFIRLYI